MRKSKGDIAGFIVGVIIGLAAICVIYTCISSLPHVHHKYGCNCAKNYLP